MENTSLQILIDTKKKELDRLEKSIDLANKNRKKNEFLLVIICIISFIYIYPITTIDNKSVIEIPSISLKIPLQTALIGFPSLIATIYLIFIGSIIRQSSASLAYRLVLYSLKTVINTDLLPIKEQNPYPTGYPLGMMLLPSSMQILYYNKNKVLKYGNTLVCILVGFIFNVLPYLTCILIMLKSEKLIPNIFIMSWDIICLLIMIISLISMCLRYILKDEKNA